MNRTPASGEVFPMQVKVKPLPAISEPARPFIKNKVMWSGSIRGAMRTISEENYQLIVAGGGLIGVWVKVDPDKVELEDGFTHDIHGIGIYRTRDLEITIKMMKTSKRQSR